MAIVLRLNFMIATIDRNVVPKLYRSCHLLSNLTSFAARPAVFPGTPVKPLTAGTSLTATSPPPRTPVWPLIRAVRSKTWRLNDQSPRRKARPGVLVYAEQRTLIVRKLRRIQHQSTGHRNAVSCLQSQRGRNNQHVSTELISMSKKLVTWGYDCYCA